MNLKEVLQAFLDHRREVLLRRSRRRLDEVGRRMEILRGQMIVYLNIDEVIRIIREEDDPKAVMQRKWKLTDLQVEAILNLRLRALRRLEEIAIRQELEKLEAEEGELNLLLAEEKRQWKAIAGELKETAKEFGGETKLGRRRTEIADAPAPVDVPVDALIEREPVTLVCSEKGWIRTIKGHAVAPAEIKYKEGDAPRFLLPVETTDKVLVFGTNGRFYTLAVDKLPGGRGHGEPLRLMIDLGNENDVVALLPVRAGQKLLVAAADGRGFVVPAEECVSDRRAGKQVLVPGDGVAAKVCVPVEGDSVALLGDNRKLLICGLDEVPEMARGRGVILQRFKDGGLADVKVFARKDGLTWKLGEKTRTETDLKAWRAPRATTGRVVPQGFPRSNRFG
jgi:topoisomerase-4 subunit A